MEVLKKIFKIQFDEDIKSMNKLDGLIALAYYFVYILLIYLFGLLFFESDIKILTSSYISNSYISIFLVYVLFSLVFVSPILLILYKRKQRLKSVGLKKEKVIKSIIVGIIASIPFLYVFIISLFSGSMKLQNNFGDLIWIFLYFLICIAFVEELIFRGFIQTRIQGLIKSKWISILTVGIMFATMHIPFQMQKVDMNFVEFIVFDYKHLIITSLLHIYFVYLYTRDNNILSPTVTHTLINFVGTVIR